MNLKEFIEATEENLETTLQADTVIDLVLAHIWMESGKDDVRYRQLGIARQVHKNNPSLKYPVRLSVFRDIDVMALLKSVALGMLRGESYDAEKMIEYICQDPFYADFEKSFFTEMPYNTPEGFI